MHDSILQMLGDYQTCYPDESSTVERFKDLVTTQVGCLDRNCLPGHLTASAFVLSRNSAKTALVFHRKLNLWINPGGHADGDPHLEKVALKEVEEETGLTALVAIYRRNLPIPLDLDIHHIPEHGGMPQHLHFDVRFLFRCNGSELLRCSEESLCVRWFSSNELAILRTDESTYRLEEKAAALVCEQEAITINS
jgi:8-oxo-dGTP pyrophosphatase MutT (NUDIX family)